MKNRARWLAAVLCLLLQGCPGRARWKVTAFNNSGHDLYVIYVDEEIRWPSHDRLEINNNRLFQTKTDGVVRTQLLETKSGNVTLTYPLTLKELVLLPKNFRSEDESFITLYLQLEPDGLLYAVKPAAKWPTEIASPQPSGFPIPPLTQN